MVYGLFIRGYTRGMNIRYSEVQIYRFYPVILRVLNANVKHEIILYCSKIYTTP